MDGYRCVRDATVRGDLNRGVASARSPEWTASGQFRSNLLRALPQRSSTDL